MLKLQIMLAALVSAPYHADTEYLLIGAQQHPTPDLLSLSSPLSK